VSQRNSGYARQERDFYESPAWIVEALLPHLPRQPKRFWEPAAGNGAIVNAVKAEGYSVIGTDLESGTDFLQVDAARSTWTAS
jgi:hypothetical protein